MVVRTQMAKIMEVTRTWWSWKLSAARIRTASMNIWHFLNFQNISFVCNIYFLIIRATFSPQKIWKLHKNRKKKVKITEKLSLRASHLHLTYHLPVFPLLGLLVLAFSLSVPLSPLSFMLLKLGTCRFTHIQICCCFFFFLHVPLNSLHKDGFISFQHRAVVESMLASLPDFKSWLCLG